MRSQAAFWNLYNTISTHCQSVQPEKASSQSASHRFLIKLLKKHPDSVPLMMLVAHHCAITRNLGLGKLQITVVDACKFCCDVII